MSKEIDTMKEDHCCFCMKCKYCRSNKQCVEFNVIEITPSYGNKTHECACCCDKYYYSTLTNGGGVEVKFHDIKSCKDCQEKQIKEIEHEDRGICNHRDHN